MPTLETLDYERFSYDEANQQPLSLDEAIKKASELRRSDKSHFYRIEFADDSNSNFRINKVAVSSVYSDFLSRVTKLIGRYQFRSQHK